MPWAINVDCYFLGNGLDRRVGLVRFSLSSLNPLVDRQTLKRRVLMTISGLTVHDVVCLNFRNRDNFAVTAQRHLE